MKRIQRFNKISYILVALFLCVTGANAQKCLSPGDLVILGVNTDANGSTDDEFTVLTLVDLPVNTAIYFTDAGWTGSGFYATEHMRKFTVSTAISAGTIIPFTCVGTTWSATNFSVATPSGEYSSNNAGLSTSGDQVILFQGSVASPVFIGAVTTAGTSWHSGASTSNESALPTGLTNNVNAKAVGQSGTSTEWDDARFDGTVTSLTGSKNRILNLVYGGTWNGSNTLYSPLTAVSSVTIRKYFRSAGSGDWNSNSVWEVSSNGSTYVASSANDYPNSPDDEVTIQNGHTIDLNNGAFNTAYLKNLTINSGGTLKAGLATDRYLKLYGDVTVNGTLGNGTTDDYTVFDLMNGSHTFNGTPTDMVLGNIRNNCFCQTTTNVILNADMTLDYSSAGIYNNVSGQALNVTISAGKTVNLRDNTNLSIDGTDGTGTGNRTGTLTINGTLNVGGNMYLKTNNASGNNITVTVANGGKLKVEDVMEGNSGTGPSLGIMNLNSGAILELSGPKSGNDPCNNISASSLNTWNFNANSTVIFSKTSGTQNIEDEFGTIASSQHYGHLTLENGATKLLEGNILVRGNLLLTQSGGAKLDVDNTNNYSINLKGNWTDNSSADGFDERLGTVTFSGTARQIIGGSTDFAAFNNLIINNTTAGTAYDDILLNANTQVNGTLTLTNGIIKSSSVDPFILIDGASISSSGNPETGNTSIVANMGHKNSFINGPCTWTYSGTDGEKIFPIGKNNQFGPCAIDPVANATGEFSAEYFNSSYGNILINTSQTPKLDHVSTQEYWNITKNTVSVDAQVKLYWKHYSSSSISLFNSLRVAHFDGSLWSMEGNTFGGGTGDISIDSSNGADWGFIKGSASSSFSPFTLGTLASFVPLPMSWIKLSAINNTSKNNNLISFTVSQSSALKYEIEKYFNGEFRSIGNINANYGSDIQEYNFIDPNPNDNISYYRIKAVSSQNVVLYSEIFSCSNSADAVARVSPNPVEHTLQISFLTGKTNKENNYIIYDNLGRKQLCGTVKNNAFILVDTLSSGFYMIQVIDETGLIQRIRFFKK